MSGVCVVGAGVFCSLLCVLCGVCEIITVMSKTNLHSFTHMQASTVPMDMALMHDSHNAFSRHVSRMDSASSEYPVTPRQSLFGAGAVAEDEDSGRTDITAVLSLVVVGSISADVMATCATFAVRSLSCSCSCSSLLYFS